MENLFSDLEGLRLAMEVESRGQEFYHYAYQKATQQEHKDLFMLLMDEEKHHLEAFTNMFDVVAKRKEAHSTDYLFDTDTSRYLTVLAESHIFPRSEQVQTTISSLQTIKAILQVAMQAEKDSILLYDEMARSAKFNDAKKIFEELKEEEQRHVIKLREIINAWA